MKVISTADISKIREDVKLLLEHDNSGHGIDHVDRVLRLALSFAEREKADKTIVTLAALLHDVDDYKVFGEESAKNLTNATSLLNKYAISTAIKDVVLHIIKLMGYSKYLAGIRPDSLEGMIVSDADMCDAIGAIGILRTYTYTLSKGGEFFDKTILPEKDALEASQYKKVKKSHSVQHFFDKLLIIPDIMMTKSGKTEGKKRKRIMTDFLKQLFAEENSEEWSEYLKSFQKTN